MKEGFPWQPRKDSNPPKVFYNFIGPESDELQYVSSFPETDLSLALTNGGADEESTAAASGAARAAREANLLRLRVMERAEHNQGAQDARRIALMRRDKQRFGSDPNQIPFVSLKRQADRDPTRLVPAPTNPAIQGGGMDHLLSARGRAFSLLGSGSGSKAEKSDLAVADASKKAAMEEQGSPSANSNANKKLKAAIQNVETIVIPKPMPRPTAQGSGSGSGSGSFGSDDVILKGYLKKNDADGQVRVVCMCHGQAHTPEKFLKHAGGACGFNGGSEPTCYVTVSVSVPAHE